MTFGNEYKNCGSIAVDLNVDSTRNNYIYGIAFPNAEADKCIRLIRKNWALKHLKIRLYGVFYEEGRLTAREYLPRDIYP